MHTGVIASNGGEKKLIAAPYESIPLFLRAGSIIPLGPQIEYTQQKPAENIRLFVYAGKGGEFTLYEDEGTNYGYEAGRFSRIRFTYNDSSRSLTISDREGSFPGMLNKRTFTLVLVSPENAKALDADAEGKMVKYNGKKTTVKL